MRWGANIALLVGAEVAYVGLFLALEEAAPSVVLTAIVFVLAFTLPFLPLYLGALARLPKRWTHRQKRVAAIVASPLVLTFFIVVALVAGGFAAALVLIGLTGAMAYGALVRIATSEPANRRTPG